MGRREGVSRRPRFIEFPNYGRYALKRLLSVFMVFVLFGLTLDEAAESAKQYFEIRSIQTRKRKNFVFLEIKYKCNVKKVESAELKVYGLLKKGRHERLASGSFDLRDIKKGTHKQNLMITAGYIKQHGNPKKVRAEIWYDNRILASKTEPRPKKKWWQVEKEEEKDVLNIIIQSDRDLEKLLRDEED